MNTSTTNQANDMRGKAVMVTGGTDGIGKATALELAKLGAHVLVAGRNRDKGEAVVADLKRQSGNPAIDLLIADLADLGAVRQLAQEVTARYERLHVLVNNAGVILPTRRATADGLEMMFAVNYLAPFLLTNLLLPLMKRSAPARVVNVSSLVDAFAKIDFDDLQSTRRKYKAMPIYAQSKLAVVLATYELARRLAGTGVTANVLEPGGVATTMSQHLLGLEGLMFKVMRPVMTSPEQGARTSIYLASSPEVEGVSGKYFNSKGQATKSAKIPYDEAVARQLWSIGEQLTGLRSLAPSGELPPPFKTSLEPGR